MLYIMQISPVVSARSSSKVVVEVIKFTNYVNVLFMYIISEIIKGEGHWMT